MFNCNYIQALEDYNKARRGAAVQELLPRLLCNIEDIGNNQVT